MSAGVGRHIVSMRRTGAHFARHIQRQLATVIRTCCSVNAAAALPVAALCRSTATPAANPANSSVSLQPVVVTAHLSRTAPSQPLSCNFSRYATKALSKCGEAQAPPPAPTHRHIHTCAGAALSSDRPTSSLPPTPTEGSADDPSELLNQLVNYERIGIPDAAGTAASSAFDLSRMRRLLAALGDPHMQLQAVHVAGSKGAT